MSSWPLQLGIMVKVVLFALQGMLLIMLSVESIASFFLGSKFAVLPKKMFMDSLQQTLDVEQFEGFARNN